MARATDNNPMPRDGVTGHGAVHGHDDAAIRRALVQALASIEGVREPVDSIQSEPDDSAAPHDGEPGNEPPGT